jgi:hypothetical protein
MCTLHVTGIKTSRRVHKKPSYYNTHRENAKRTTPKEGTRLNKNRDNNFKDEIF